MTLNNIKEIEKLGLLKVDDKYSIQNNGVTSNHRSKVEIESNNDVDFTLQSK